ncbi:MAG: insulinase family protein [Anaerolineae bacterium]|nr:MAG: insulinase family protein [Anaerolineae bacterium]
MFTKTTLQNGLVILLKEIHTAPLISHWVWYRVGSKDEPTGKTGVSHWVEHMQFKGTAQFPASMLDKAIAREGGTWNAFTFLDWTTYYETLPADKIELALRLEADRMVNSRFDPSEVEAERTVILSEREGNENEPLFRLGEAIQAAAFRVHPYHHEVIGDAADLRSLTRDDLYAHYKTFYIPNNAVLTMAGDFETEAMLRQIEDQFGPLSSAPSPPRLNRPEPEPQGEVRLTVEGPGETTYLQVSYHVPAASHPDFHALAVLDSLLAGPSNLNMFGGGGISNKTSRLYRALVDTERAVSVHGGWTATVDPFLYTFTITAHPKYRIEKALTALDAELARLQDTPPSEEEVIRAIKQSRAIFAYGAENITNQAFWLGYAEMFAEYGWFTSYLDKLAQVTPADVQRVAQTWFRSNRRVVGTYIPVEEGGAS